MCKFKIGDGKRARFWEDWWIGNAPLNKNYPRLYDLCFDKNKTVKQVFNKGLENVQFRRTLLGDARELWGILERLVVW